MRLERKLEVINGQSFDNSYLICYGGRCLKTERSKAGASRAIAQNRQRDPGCSLLWNKLPACCLTLGGDGLACTVRAVWSLVVLASGSCWALLETFARFRRPNTNHE